MARPDSKRGAAGPRAVTFDIPNPSTGISPREHADIASTWTVIKNDLSKNGCDLFINLFAAFPEHRRAFPAFVGLTEEELRTSAVFRKHCNSVMYAVSSVIEHLADVDCLRSMLFKLGQNHNRDHVNKQAFDDLKTTFILWLQQKLGQRLTPVTLLAWEKMLGLTISYILKGMERQRGRVSFDYSACDGKRTH